MKSMMWRTTFREIRQSLGRFLAILAIVALGVGLFAGLKVAREAMVKTAYHYLTETQLYDYRVVTTLGLDDEDVAVLAAQKDVRNVEGSYTFDAICQVDGGSEVVLRAHSMTETVNDIRLTAGRLPESPEECVLDCYAYGPSQIGKKIILSDTNAEGDLESFACREYTVVGLVQSPYYIQYERGNTSLGTGTISGFMYLRPDGFASDYFTEAFVKFEEDYDLYSDAYDTYMEEKESEWEEVLDSIAAGRYEKVQKLYQGKLLDAREELEDGRSEGEKELQDAWAKLQDARQEIEDGEAELADGRREIEENRKKLQEGEEDLDEAEETIERESKRIEDGWAQLQEQEAQWESKNSEVQGALQQLDLAKSQLDLQRPMLETVRSILSMLSANADLGLDLGGLSGSLGGGTDLNGLAGGLGGGMDLSGLAGGLGGGADLSGLAGSLGGGADLGALGGLDGAGLASVFSQDGSKSIGQQVDEGIWTIYQYQIQIDEARKQLEDASVQLQDGKRQLEEARRQLVDGEIQLSQAKVELAEGRAEIREGRKELEEGEKELEEGEKELEEGRAEYEDGLKEYEEGKADFDQEIADGEKKIADAEKELEDMEPAEGYLLGRDTNIGYVCFENDSSIVDGIANVFPVFFFAVAALVCITTMNRMVEEQRTQIGVLKALGYSEFRIMGKYLFYSGSAAVLGCLIGFFGGTWLFPKVIWTAYGIMYRMESLRYVFDWKLMAISLAVSCLCSIGTTWLSCRYELGEVAAELMRPKAPKAGKRVLLERVPFIWSRMKFLYKVSYRNIFRYKKRFFMMVIGISGCTALLVTGFGIKDSIVNVVSDQFHQIQLYDFGITFSRPVDPEMEADLRETLGERSEGFLVVLETAMDMKVGESVKNVSLLAFDEEQDLTPYLSLHDTGDVPLPMPGLGECILNDKLADDYGVEIGDTIRLQEEGGEYMDLTVSGRNENFVYNYVYITLQTYEERMGKKAECKTAYVNMAEGEDPHLLSASLMRMDGVANVNVNADLEERFSSMMQSLDLIVLVVILCAAGLAFIVLYNLTNINITERVREIATIKVLGFYQKETGAYVFRENVVLTLIGALVGLVLGCFLHQYVMNEINVDMVTFQIHIKPLSYLYSIALTFAFSWFVNGIMGKKLDGISMTESLKSVD